MKEYVFAGILIVLIIILILASQLKFEKKKMLLEDKDGKIIELQVEMADSGFKRALGLMFRDKLNEKQGMLFVFDDEERRSFWMMNTKIPLDALFFDSNKNLVEVLQLEPCSSLNCPSYRSTKKAKYVMEVNKGFAIRNNIPNGTTFKLV